MVNFDGNVLFLASRYSSRNHFQYFLDIYNIVSESTFQMQFIFFSFHFPPLVNLQKRMWSFHLSGPLPFMINESNSIQSIQFL